MQSTSSYSRYLRYLPFVAAGLASTATLYLLYRRFSSNSRMSPHVAENLPIAKNLKTIPDTDGNYDIDGVSFDSEGVVVSGDRLT